MRKSAEKTTTPALPLIEQPKALVVDEVELQNVSADYLKLYGAYVVEDRAIPDFRDGLKPVHRAALWSMYVDKMHHNTAHKKAARVVGTVIGKFHPHGDCLRGDTLVPLLNGKTVTIKKLADSGAKSKWVLAFDPKTKKLVPAKAHSWRIGQITKTMYRIHLSTGDYVECTGNHQFYVKGRGWVKAQDLQESMSLISGIWEKSNYDKLHYRNDVTMLHKHVAETYYGKSVNNPYISHHVDHNTRNNVPKNLTIMLRSDHAAYHEDYLDGLQKGQESMFSGSSIELAQIFKHLLKRNTVESLTWKKFKNAACALSTHDSYVVHQDIERLKQTFDISSVQELLHKVKSNRLCVITKVERIKLKQPEPFYDFTVDGYENMIILPPTQKGNAARNFIVAHNSACYGAMETIATHVLPNLIDGKGGWGNHIEGAAASRYTECRLSQFSDMFLLDKDYLAVVPMIDNYDGTEKMPLFLPAKLPVQLLVGSPTVPAFGVSAGTPSFKLPGVAKLVELSLKGKTITPELCLKYLEPHFRWGGICISPEADLLNFYATGKGSIRFKPVVESDKDYKEVRILSCCPDFYSENSINKKLEKISQIDGVTHVSDSSGRGVGLYGLKYLVRMKKKTGGANRTIVEKIEKLLEGTASYNIGYTYRKRDNTSFGRMSVCDFIDTWTKYRVSLEVAVIKNLIAEERKKLARQQLLLWAVDHSEVIINALKDKKLGPKKHLMKAWPDKTEEFVTDILKLQVQQLALLERPPIVTRIKDIKSYILSLKDDLSKPNERILRTFNDEVSKYIKNTKDLIQVV